MAFLREPTLWDGVFLTRHHLSMYMPICMNFLWRPKSSFFVNTFPLHRARAYVFSKLYNLEDCDMRAEG